VPLQGDASYFEDMPLVLERHGYPEQTWHTFSCSPVRDEAGAVAGLFITAIETTARERVESALRESEERYRTLFDQMIAGVAESDLEGRLITANDRYCEMLGYSREEILRLNMRDVTHPDDLPGNLEQFHRCREEGVPFEIEKRYIRKDGSTVWVHNSVSLVRDAQGRPKSMVAAVLDVTQRVRTEQALADANRAKDEFLAMLGHELRNPLSPIVTTLQLMKLRAPDTLAAERNVIEKQVRYISDMVDDLLDVARIARGKVELKTAPVQIADIAAAAIETTQPLFDERGQMLHTAIVDGLVVSGDRRRLVQVVVNLLTNAAKYSPRGCAVYFSAAAEGHEAVLRLRDQGVGIDPALLPRVFELFTQDEQSLERSRGGLGLGLAIVRNLIEMHGGSVTASSAGRDRGSEFVVRLPLLEPRIEPPAEKAPPVPVGGAGARANAKSAPVKVLIVDDYVLAAESLGTLLQELGFETHVAHDGASALAAVAQFRPDVALIDIGLPVMDGYEVARRLRRTPGFEHLPLVALTGYGQESDRERVRQAGFDEHLVKPVDAERIGNLIERLVTR
jgi:PAS domain S-box-containing protein